MQFNLRRPCPECPFRSDIHPYLHPQRAQEIADGLKMGTWFACHKTTEGRDTPEDDYDGPGDLECVDASEHCAGAMILMEKLGWPTQAMQLSERLKYPPGAYYQPEKLDLTAPVVDTLEDFVATHSRKWPVGPTRRKKTA